MPEGIENGTEGAMLNALEPGLSFLASQAAIELDNLLLGRKTTLEAVQLLGRRLNAATEAVEGSAGRRTLMDAPTVSILSNAISASRSKNLRTLDELASESWKMANDLQDTTESANQQALKKLRSFCVCLSQIARSYRQFIEDMQVEQAAGGVGRVGTAVLP